MNAHGHVSFWVLEKRNWQLTLILFHNRWARYSCSKASGWNGLSVSQSVEILRRSWGDGSVVRRAVRRLCDVTAKKKPWLIVNVVSFELEHQTLCCGWTTVHFKTGKDYKGRESNRPNISNFSFSGSYISATARVGTDQIFALGHKEGGGLVVWCSIAH